MSITIPLFPLKTVLFPGGVLPLRVFEPRYLDMVSECLKNETGIGVISIRDGAETGKAADVYDTGTLSHISYWHKRADGILGITLKGEQRFRVLSSTVQKNQLIIAEVQLLDAASDNVITEHQQHMVELLRDIISQLEPPYTTMETNYDSADWVSARLAELLPLPLAVKQELLNMEEAGERLLQAEKLLRKKRS